MDEYFKWRIRIIFIFFLFNFMEKCIKSTTDTPYYDGMLRNPQYFLHEKGIGFYIKYMKPEDYLFKCYEMQVRDKSEMDFQTYMDTVLNKKIVDEYARKMKMGHIFPMPVLDYHISGQEGRHRAAAAKKAGCSEIPVMVVYEVRDTQGILILIGVIMAMYMVRKWQLSSFY